MGKRILVIEDETEVAALLGSRLMSAGYEVAIAPDATLAIKEAQQFKPNLVILDMMLPGGGGAGVLERLKLSVYTNQIPVIILTGMDLEECRQKIAKFNVQAIIQKPYEAPRLLEKISQILSGEKPAEAKAGGKKILVVDDDLNITDLLNTRLSANGYVVQMADNGEEALRYFETFQPDLVIVDLMMPHMSGWQLGQRIKEKEKDRKVPVIVLSALIQEEGKSGDLEVGDFYMAKPFDSEKLLAKVKEFLSS